MAGSPARQARVLVVDWLRAILGRRPWLFYAGAGAYFFLYWVFGEVVTSKSLLWCALGLYVIALVFLFRVLILQVKFQQLHGSALGTVVYFGALVVAVVVSNAVMIGIAQVLFGAAFSKGQSQLDDPGNLGDRVYLAAQAMGTLGGREFVPKNTAARYITLFQFVFSPSILVSFVLSQVEKRLGQRTPEGSDEADA